MERNRAVPGMRHTAWAGWLMGVLLCALLASAAWRVGRVEAVQAYGLNVLTLSIVLGLLAGNTVYPRWAHAVHAGVGFSKQHLLRWGVVLYGLRLTWQDMGHIGWAGVAVDVLMLASTFGLAFWIGVRWLGLDRKTAMLIGAGNAICGAAAVLATEPVVKARTEQVTVAVATVVLFGTLAVFLYPLLFQWGAGGFVPGGDIGFGLYAGSTIQEVAQVLAAAHTVGAEATDAAVIEKMVRVMMLAPFLLLLSVWLARPSEDRPDPAVGAGKVTVPWFALGFVLVVLFNSCYRLPLPLGAFLLDLDNGLLAMAMAALGLTTHLAALRTAGVKPMALAGLLSFWLIVGGAGINRLVMSFA